MKNSSSANPSFIRDINRAGILDLIRKQGAISQAEIAKTLKLQPSTVLRITADLMEEQLIVPKGLGKSNAKGGRRATLLELNAEGAYALGVDLNPEEILVVKMNIAGTVTDEIRRPCPSRQGPLKVLDALKDAIQTLLEAHPASSGKILSIGVAVPGKVNSEEGVSLFAVNFTDWHNVPIAEELKQAFDLPVYVDHDISSMAYGELWFGERRDNMLCLGMRGGIGLGLVMNGELYRGSNWIAGDVGHVIVDPEGPECSCGRRGCLETLASEKAIVTKARDFALRKNLTRIGGVTVEKLDIAAIHDALKNGDAMILEIVLEAAGYLGKMLCDLVRIFDPRIIVMGGHGSLEFLQLVRTTYRAAQPNYADTVAEIENSAFGERSIAIGAASQIISALFKPKGKLA